jgi:hypothetical protein
MPETERFFPEGVSQPIRWSRSRHWGVGMRNEKIRGPDEVRQLDVVVVLEVSVKAR